MSRHDTNLIIGYALAFAGDGLRYGVKDMGFAMFVVGLVWILSAVLDSWLSR